MKIYIANISNTYNYGSMMMAEVLINYLNNNISNVSFYIDAKTPDHIDRLKTATGVDAIYKDYTYNSYTNIKSRIIRKILRDIKLFVSFKLKKSPYDAIIILGGDDYSEIYFKIPKQNITVINHLKKLNNYNKSSKLFMLGQTIGPYTGKRLDYAIKTFKDIDIYSRDEISKKYLKNTMDKDAFEMRDLAFMNLNKEKELLEDKDNILKYYGLIENEYITVVGSGLYNCYSQNEKEFNDTFIVLLNTLKEKYVDKKIVLLAHVTNKDTFYSDISFINKIKEGIPEDVVLIDEQMLPAKARVILGLGYLTISYRMHAAVSTFHMGRPAICLSYSPKYMGVIGDGLNMQDLIIESTPATFKVEKIICSLKEKLEYVDNNYINILHTIKQKVEKSNNMTLNALKDIVDKIIN